MGIDWADIAELAFWIVAICCLFSTVFALYAWVGRTLGHRRSRRRHDATLGAPPRHVNCRCTITRTALPDAEGDIQFMRHGDR